MGRIINQGLGSGTHQGAVLSCAVLFAWCCAALSRAVWCRCVLCRALGRCAVLWGCAVCSLSSSLFLKQKIQKKISFFFPKEISTLPNARTQACSVPFVVPRAVLSCAAGCLRCVLPAGGLLCWLCVVVPLPPLPACTKPHCHIFNLFNPVLPCVHLRVGQTRR